MSERWRFQFSVANVLLMTFAVALILGGVSGMARTNNSRTANVVIDSIVLGVGIPMAIGALGRGFKGLLFGLALGASVVVVVAFVGLILMTVLAGG